jgi:glycosyltransferase involved in cell wall biosynthesis
MMNVGPRTLRLVLRTVLTYLIELLAVLLAQYIIVESKSMKRYVPGIKIFKQLIISKIIDYGALYADPEFFSECTPFEERDEVIGYVGALEHRRASIELIEAFRIVARLNPNVRFLLIGSGALEPKIRKIVYGNYELRDRTMYIKHVSREDLPRYLSKICIFVFPTKADGLPNTILEALACGCVVLATPVGGIPDVIKDNVTGYYMHGSLEPMNIANHIIRILNLPKEKLEEVSLNARRFVERYYGYAITLSRWKSIISLH